MELRFLVFSEGITKDPFISVDGVMDKAYPNEVLNLGHWPGNRTPPQLKANTAVEMALKLVETPNWRLQLGSTSVLTNHHYDTDGVLSCWILLAPDVAPQYAEGMISAAVAGDYGLFTTPYGVKLDLLLTNLQDPRRSPLSSHLSEDPTRNIQVLYDWVHERLPALFAQVDSYAELWTPEYEVIEADLRFIASGGATVREYPNAVLSVIESDRPLNVIARWSRTQFGRLLSIVHRQDGTLFEFQYALPSFHDRIDRPSLSRPELSCLAEQFNERETAPQGRWVFDDNRFIPKLHFANADGLLESSGLPPAEVKAEITDYFAQFGESWPYLAESPWGHVVSGEFMPVVPWPS